MRLIDADALDRAFTMLRFNDDKTLKHWGDRQDWCMSGQEVEDLINSVPTINPERKTGRWIEYDNSRCECPFCHEEWSYFDNDVERFNYCPNCGADMGGDTDGSD